MEQRHLTVREIVTLSCQALSGLHNIHPKGLIHFDIKPDNILLSNRGEALVSDFGLTRQINSLGMAQQTLFYLRTVPPEGFIAGQHPVTFDIFQFGMMLYRMCNGLEEFDRQFEAVVGPGLDRIAFRNAVQNAAFPDRTRYLAHIPQRLRKVVSKCLEPNPADRFQSALELSNAIAEVDGDVLDWQFSVAADGSRRWHKWASGTTTELVVAIDGSCVCHKQKDGGPKRRHNAMCLARVTDAQVRRFLGGT
jgi:serine/threonine protein kinase